LHRQVTLRVLHLRQAGGACHLMTLLWCMDLSVVIPVRLMGYGSPSLPANSCVVSPAGSPRIRWCGSARTALRCVTTRHCYVLLRTRTRCRTYGSPAVHCFICIMVWCLPAGGSPPRFVLMRCRVAVAGLVWFWIASGSVVRFCVAALRFQDWLTATRDGGFGAGLAYTARSTGSAHARAARWLPPLFTWDRILWCLHATHILDISGCLGSMDGSPFSAGCAMRTVPAVCLLARVRLRWCYGFLTMLTSAATTILVTTRWLDSVDRGWFGLVCAACLDWTWRRVRRCALDWCRRQCAARQRHRVKCEDSWWAIPGCRFAGWTWTHVPHHPSACPTDSACFGCD